MRVYLVGSHSTGKTTLARYISETYDIPMIAEVARAVLAEMEVPLEELRTDIDLVNEYQSLILSRQMLAEKSAGGSFVSDRAFDNLAYAAEHSTLGSQLFESPELSDYIKTVQSGIVLFIRPHKELLFADGTRETPTWESVLRIDGMIKLLLEIFSIPYLPVDCMPMQERARLVEFIMRDNEVIS